MQETTVPITFSGRVRLKSLIIIRQEMPFQANLFDIVRGKWQLPNAHNPMIMRPEVMRELETKMQAQPENRNFAPVLRLCGERGVGKTHMAMQFAHAHYENARFQSVVWLNITDNNLDSLESQWIYLCAGLGLKLSEELSLADMITLAYQKIISYGEALFVFDGVEDYLSIEPYLKFNNPAITILITSRNGITWGYNDRHCELKPFTEEQAISWLEQWCQRNNRQSEREHNRQLALKAQCHPLRLQELATLITHQTGSAQHTVKFQSNVDINVIEQDEFAFRFLGYCALLCPYQEVELEFFVLLYKGDMRFEVTEAIFLLKQHGMIGYPRKSNYFYTPSILADIGLKGLNNKDKIGMITELLQVSLKVLSPNNASSMINHISHLVEIFLEMLDVEYRRSPTFSTFFQNVRSARLLEVVKDFSPLQLKFVELYNQILSSNNRDMYDSLRNCLKDLRESFQQKPSLEVKYDKK